MTCFNRGTRCKVGIVFALLLQNTYLNPFGATSEICLVILIYFPQKAEPRNKLTWLLGSAQSTEPDIRKHIVLDRGADPYSAFRSR